ncbi:hypothetical protein QQ045_030780 [Rhodiola kirilowii]
MDIFNFGKNQRARQQRRRERDEMANSFIVSAITMMNDEDDVPTRCRPNLPRQRESRGQNLMDDYFVERPIFPQQDFHRRYRMSINLFNRIKNDLCSQDEFWVQRRDADGLLGLLHEQKMTGAIRMVCRDHKNGCHYHA